ncbi:MAG TPA: GNAT family N-acetyltransferase [Rhizobiales bacterium]|nr:GNAT family N-acetyltransferase [Hyphomicrobiales bacterium]
MDQKALKSNQESDQQVTIRQVASDDLDFVTALDKRVTGLAKPDYWQDIFNRYVERQRPERFFLVAEDADSDISKPVLGFIVGEVRAWEFGSEPSGWVFAFSVDPDVRERGVGELLFETISEKFLGAGVKTMRTMVERKNQLHMAFFRSEGMAAGPYIQLEKDLDE